MAAGAAFEGLVREILVDPPDDPLLQGMDLDSRLRCKRMRVIEEVISRFDWSIKSWLAVCFLNLILQKACRQLEYSTSVQLDMPITYASNSYLKLLLQ